jgi:ABC-type multidrug transport system fused ATPase/permease subunit
MTQESMSTTPTTITSETNVRTLQRLSNTVGAGIFLLVQRFPRVLKFQRSEHSWSVFRVLLGCFGAALVILPLSFWIGWVTGIVTPLVGMVLFIASILLPPPEMESDTDRKARELGATTMVSGGEYQSGDIPAVQARFFLSPANIWALDKNFNPLVVIPTAEISSIFVDSIEDCWLLHVHWADRKAEFSYDGIFAERFARLAEESIRSLLPGGLSAPLKRHATAS